MTFDGRGELSKVQKLAALIGRGALAGLLATSMLPAAAFAAEATALQGACARVGSGLASAAPALGRLLGSDDSSEVIALDETNFPDPVFRTWVRTKLFGGASVESVTREQADAVTSIVLAPQDGASPDTTGVTDLTGISFFRNLTKLDCKSNKGIRSLDLSGNTELTELDLRSDSIADVDLSPCIKLEKADGSGNATETLTLPATGTLTEIVFNGNNLSPSMKEVKGLDVCTGLKRVTLDHNKLTSLDTSKLASLEYLCVSNNQLASLDVSANTELAELDAGNQILSGTGVLSSFTGTTSLQKLYLGGNSLEGIDLKGYAKLEELSVRNNAALVGIDLSDCVSLKTLYCGSTQISELDLSKCPALEELHAERDKGLVALDLSNNPLLAYLDASRCSLETVALGVKTAPLYAILTNNQLVSIDCSQCKSVSSLNTSNNSRAIESDAGKIEMGACTGFDPSKVSSVTGAQFDASANCFYNVIGGRSVSYCYGAGAGQSVSFTIKTSVSVATADGTIKVVDTEGNEVPALDGGSNELTGLPDVVTVKEATTDGNSIVVPLDSRSKLPLAAKVTVSSGTVTVDAYYPVPICKTVDSQAVQLSSLSGEEQCLDMPVAKSGLKVYGVTGDKVGSYNRSLGVITISSNSAYEPAIAAELGDCADEDGDGLIDKVVVTTWYRIDFIRDDGKNVTDRNADNVLITEPVAENFTLKGEGVSKQGSWGKDLRILVARNAAGYNPATAYVTTEDTDKDGQIDVVEVELLYPIPVVSESGDAVPSDIRKSYADKASVAMVDSSVEVVGGSYVTSADGAKIIVPNDEYGNPPAAVSISTGEGGYNEQGGAYKVVIAPTRSTPVLSEDGAPICDTDGKQIHLNPFETDMSELVDGIVINGGTYKDDGTIVLPNDEFGNAPYVATCTGTKDGDSDGYLDTASFTCKYPVAVLTEAAEKATDSTGGIVTVKGELASNVQVTGGTWGVVPGAIVIPNNDRGYVPVNVAVSSYDDDGDGLIERVAITADYVVPTHSLSYELDGGTNAPGNPDTYTEGSAVKLADPTRAGYSFEGWYTDPAYTEKIGAIGADATQDFTLYAKWKAREYAISYELAGGTNASGNPAAYTYGVGVESFAAPSRAGYSFVGWYRDEGYVYKATGIDAATMGSITLYAKWEGEVNAITYKLDGGDNAASNPSFYVTGSEVKLEPALREHYDFVGWYLDAAFSKPISKIDASMHGPVTLYAKWVGNEYRISYELGGGTNAPGNPAGYSSGQVIAWQDPVREGWSFDGWYLDAAFTERTTGVTAQTSGDLTLHAKWSCKVTLPKAAKGLVYNGKMQTGVAGGIGYELSGATGTNAGTYKATLTLLKGASWADGATGRRTVEFKIAKAAQKLSVKGAVKTVKAKKLKKRGARVKLISKVAGAKGKLSYKKIGGSAKLKVNARTGKVTVKKGAKKGRYKVKVKVMAASSANYAAASKRIALKVKVK